MKTESLRVEHINKSINMVKVLDDLCFEVYEGEILGIFGLSGSGKSVIAGILSGTMRYDTGRIFIQNSKAELKSTVAAQRKGIFCIRQKTCLTSELLVYENMILGQRHYPVWGWANRKMFEKMKTVFEQLNLKIPLHKKTSDCSLAEQHLLEIARAVLCGCKILILDDITYGYNYKEYTRLRQILWRLKEILVSVIYIDSRLDNVILLSDRILTLRHGRDTYCFAYEEFEYDRILRTVKDNRQVKLSEKISPAAGPEDLILEVCGVDFNKLKNISFHLGKGEVIGFVQKDSHNFTEILSFLGGNAAVHNGMVFLEGRSFDMTRGYAYMVKNGFGYVSDYQSSAFYNLKVKDNFTVSALNLFGGHGYIQKHLENLVAREYLEEIGVNENEFEMRMCDVSYVNQKKIIMHKWIFAQAKIIVLDNPFRGMDVVMAEVLRDFFSKARELGLAVVCTLPNESQYMEYCDRIYMFDGKQLQEV